jgi:hypothetical protein
MLYNRTQLACLRADFTGAGKSDFMTGHSTQTAGPVIDTETTLGNGSVQAFESCKGTDNVIVPRVGSLIWIEFQVMAMPSADQTYTSTFDITTPSPADNWVKDADLVTMTITTGDGILVIVPEFNLLTMLPILMITIVVAIALRKKAVGKARLK